VSSESAEDIHIEVDLRAQWSGARDQGLRNACLACATSDAHGHSHGLRDALSAEFLYFHAAQRMPGSSGALGLTFAAAGDALAAEGQPLEQEWPYQSVQPAPWVPPTVTARWYGDLTMAAAITGLHAALQSRRPIVLALRLTPEWLDPVASRSRLKSSGTGFGCHAVLGVGLGEHSTAGPLVLVRNSWGERWGQGGYAWVEEGYFQDKLVALADIRPRAP